MRTPTPYPRPNVRTPHSSVSLRNGNRPAVVLLALCLLAWSLPGAAARAEQAPERAPLILKSHTKFLEVFRPVVAEVAESTVRVLCDGEEVALGTVVGEDGWVVTKASQLSGEPRCRLRDGRSLAAEVVGVNEEYDLALLKVAATGLKPVRWADSKLGLVGNWVASPGTGELPTAVGVISVATRKLSPLEMRLHSGMSGGFLGIGMEMTEEGVKINRVFPDSGADKAGLKVDDLILEVGGRKVETSEALSRALQRLRPGEAVELRVRRAGRAVTVKATLGKRPSDLLDPGQKRSLYQNSLGSKLSERRDGFPTVLQHDSVILPTDCGGPLVDLDGRVLGLNIARAGRTESYAIPGEVVASVLKELRAEKTVSGAVPGAAPAGAGTPAPAGMK